MEEMIYKDFSTPQSLKFCDCGTTVICHTQSFVDITKKKKRDWSDTHQLGSDL